MSLPAPQLLLAAAPGLKWPDGRALPLAVRDALLLTWLAIEGPTPRNRLAALLWPQADAAAARNALRQRLFQLRRQLGLPLVEGQATLALAAGIGHDLDDADDVLAGLMPDVGGELEHWLAQQRQRRRDRVRQALADLSTMAESARDWGDALGHARELLALEPTSEEAHRRVIRLHYLAGDRAAALQAFDHCEQVLKNEVGARPSPETLALLRTVEASAQPVGHAVPVAVLRPPRLVGRDAERAVLRHAAESSGAVVLLRGEAGMGKSRLLVDLADALRDGLLSVSARPGDAAVPHALLARWLRALLQRTGWSLAEGERELLARVLPELGPASVAEPRERLALVLQTLPARVPGLQALALDDLQFADEASLSLLLPLAGATGPAWVLAHRPAELPPGGAGPASAQALCRHTGGNPLFLLETLKLLHTEGQVPDAPLPRADGLLRRIQQRLARLSPLASKLMRCAAVAGQDFDAALAAQVLGLRPLDLVEAWSELEAAQVLQGQRFAHDLIAEAASASVPAPLAVPLHAEIAAVLEARGGVPARVAAHWLAAQQPLRAVPGLLAAARHAVGAWQPLEAARCLAQAADLLAAAGQNSAAFDALLRVFTLLGDQGDDPRLRPWLERLVTLAADDGQRASLAAPRAYLHAIAGDLAAARREALQALPQAARTGRADVEVELLWTLTALDWDGRDPAAAARHAEQALQRLPAAARDNPLHDPDRMRFQLLHALGLVHAATGRYPESDARLAEALAAAQALRARQLAEGLAGTLAMNALEQGRLGQALDWAEQALANDDREGTTANVRAMALASASMPIAVQGDLGRALVLSERSVALCVQGRLRFEASACRRHAGLLHELGRRDLALKALQALHRREDQSPADQTLTAAALLGLGAAMRRRDAAAVVERVAALEDFPIRARMLALAQPGCDPEHILPLLAVTAGTARDQGALGLWLGVQASRVAALRRGGRLDEAAEQALKAWDSLQAGHHAMDTLPRVAAELCAALQRPAPEAAQAIARRAAAWMQQAAVTLPALWQRSYLARSPALAVLPLRPGVAPALPLSG